MGVRQAGKAWIVSLDPKTGEVREKELDEDEEDDD